MIITASTDLEQKFRRAVNSMLSVSKRDAVAVLKEQARGVVRYVQQYTPPASRGKTGAAAKKQGEAAARARLSAYGLPKQAYDIIEERQGEAMAKHFWKLYKTGEVSRASDMIRHLTGKGLAPFDGGAIYHRLVVGRKRARGIHYFVSDPDKLKAFATQALAHVGTLASGWGSAMQGLTAAQPVWIGRHGSAGTFKLHTTAEGVWIEAKNNIIYDVAKKTHMDSMIGYGLRAQTGKINLRMQRYKADLLRRSGFRR